MDEQPGPPTEPVAGGSDRVPDNIERERRFLITDLSAIPGIADADGVLITQAYVFAVDGYAVRVRRIQRSQDDGPLTDVRSTMALKGPSIGDERVEYETDIDAQTAQAVIARSTHVVVKRRLQRVSQGQAWDVDVFEGENAGLALAELEGVGIRAVSRPWWAAMEVTTDVRFTNDYLAFHPYSSWK